MGRNIFKLLRHLRATCCRHRPCEGKSKSTTILKLCSALLSPAGVQTKHKCKKLYGESEFLGGGYWV